MQLSQDLLKEIPLFSGLSEPDYLLLREKAVLREYKKGQIIYEEGAPADAFYCIVMGRVVIYTKTPQGEESVLEYLHRGKYFGIISLLTNEPHSVTARAINDCIILTLTKDDFGFILNKIPRLAIDLSLTLSRRLKNKGIHQKVIFESTIISVFSSYSQAGKTVYALNLALSLRKETHKRVLILDILPQDKIHSLPAKLGIDDCHPIDLSALGLEKEGRSWREGILKTSFDIDLACLFYQAEDVAFVNKLLDIISILVNDYHYIILDLPSKMDQSIFSILNQSDLIHLITSPQAIDLGKTHHLITRLVSDFNFKPSKIKVIINEYKFSKISHEEQASLLRHPVFATLPKKELVSSDRLVLDCPDCEYAKAVRRISRQLGDCLVGLALGVGVAYGLCHIGVLKVIEEEKLPIDVICGSSIGALVAALWVTGRSTGEILEIFKEFREPKYIWNIVDLTIPTVGFIKGKKLYTLLKKYLGTKTFYDVKLPLKVIASEIKKKEIRVLDKGFLADAIMASCAMPGVFMPFRLKQDLLFDGGVVNPLPTEPLFKLGVKKIIAVNVTPSREDFLSQYNRLKEDMAARSPQAIKKRKWFDIKRYFRDKFKANILDFIFSSIEMLQSELAEKEAKLADIVLHPNTQGLFWLELHKAEEFAKRGEEEARRNLDRIRQIINE
ncbi:MAG: patatin-like phospholipase family protein [Candidatus Omnitrophota bacterium]